MVQSPEVADFLSKARTSDFNAPLADTNFDPQRNEISKKYLYAS